MIGAKLNDRVLSVFYIFCAILPLNIISVSVVWSRLRAGFCLSDFKKRIYGGAIVLALIAFTGCFEI